MNKPTRLEDVRRQPHVGLVKALEQFLEEAKAGQIQGMVGVIETGHSSQHFQIGKYNKSNEAEAIIQMIKEW